MHPAIRAVFVGDGTLLIRCAQAFLDAGHTLVAVASGHPAVLDWARQVQVPAIGIGDDNPLVLPEGEFDCLFSIANLRVLPATVLARARRLALNFHDGPLPRYAGLNAPAWALMAQEARHGITWHEMTPQVDAGRIARQVLFDLAPDETAFSLNARCYEAGFQAFEALLADIAVGTLTLTPQTAPAQPLLRRHQRPEALATLDWQRPAAELQALVRGLDFGTYANPLALPKLWLGAGRVAVARSARLAEPSASEAPGTVLEVAGERLRNAPGRAPLGQEGCPSLDDEPALAGLSPGDRLPPLPHDTVQALAASAPRLARGEAHWRRVLHALQAPVLPYPRQAEGQGAGGDLSAVLHTPLAAAPAALRLPLQARAEGAATLAGLAAWLSAVCGQERVSLRYCDATLADAAEGLMGWATPWVPLNLTTTPDQPVPQARAAAEALLAKAHRTGPLTTDLRLRLGGAEGGPLLPDVGLSVGAARPDVAPPPLALWLHAPQPGAPLELRVCPRAYAAPVAQVIARSLDAWLQAFAKAEGPVAALSLLTAQEAAQRAAFNATAVPLDTRLGVPAQIDVMAAAHADTEALRWHDLRLRHQELQQRSNALARALRERGAGEGTVVGLCLERTPDLVVALLAILKSGAAYLPLDPDYPRDRLRFMLEDAQAPLVVCSEATRTLLDLPAVQAVAPDAQPSQAEAPLPEVPGTATAYLIYTSGSTGKPKGVRVSHANVLNFFAGMDARVPHEGGGRWLAVTSLSFDISVLELLWTLARGFTVVLHGPPPVVEAPAAAAPEFSLFYFATDESRQGSDRYRLLLEGARFADANGFAAVWTPERHFHAFGGLYPNPAVASAALAAMTSRVQIRAGSCVSPLHSAIRIAEDWSLVDNLSGGRVGVSFAAGWQPNDFVLAPQAFAQRKQLMLDQVDTVRRLWRGEAVDFPGHDGKPVAVRTLPRPVQKELPIWLTAAGNPETFELAGRKGCHLLTHLLGQTVEDVAQKVALYHQAWREAGHAGRGQVTMMLHTFVGADEDAVRETARGPMKAYLRSSVDLIRQAAWSFPTFVQRGAADGRTPLQVMESQPLSDEEMDALLDHAFSRYWKTSALIGTPERCLEMVRRLQDAGVDEIACLIDFGIDTGTALAHLPHLAQLMALARSPRREAAAPALAQASVAEALVRHEITHLQCTPSMATMLVADAAGRAALGRLSALLVGGEALPLALARQLREQVPGALLNMYGPTETTVWSTCCTLQQPEGFVPLGEPIANTQLVLRNAWGQDCPALVPGELLIGGAGVTQGYLGRPELNAERFIPDPADPQGAARLYRTGDLVRAHPDGRLEFLGRLDHQVKLRGHRIELGEIESALLQQPGVQEAVVVACRDAGGEPFLAGFVTPRAEGPALEGEALREALAQALPAVMVPRAVTVRASLPRTPNGKTDRQALARLGAPAPAVPRAAAGEGHPLEQAIAAIWCEVLGLPEVGRDSNFFDLGGHSLLVIQVQRRLRESLGHEVALRDMSRLPTVPASAAHLQGQGKDTAVADGLSRAQARRALRGHAAARTART